MTDWQDPESVRFMLDDCTTWAIVGLSGDPTRTAFSIAALLQGRGKRIVPIHPDAPTVLDEQGYATLADVPFPIDVVDVFRRSDAAGEFADQAVAIGAKGVWFQLGVIDADGLRPDGGRGRADGDGHLPRDRVAPPPAGPVNRPGSDLRVPSGPGLPDGLVIPAGELVERFSRSPGPGGQSVNTSDTRVRAAVRRGGLDRPQRRSSGSGRRPGCRGGWRTGDWSSWPPSTAPSTATGPPPASASSSCSGPRSLRPHRLDARQGRPEGPSVDGSTPSDNGARRRRCAGGCRTTDPAARPERPGDQGETHEHDGGRTDQLERVGSVEHGRRVTDPLDVGDLYEESLEHAD